MVGGVTIDAEGGVKRLATVDGGDLLAPDTSRPALEGAALGVGAALSGCGGRGRGRRCGRCRGGASANTGSDSGGGGSGSGLGTIFFSGS